MEITQPDPWEESTLIVESFASGASDLLVEFLATIAKTIRAIGGAPPWQHLAPGDGSAATATTSSSNIGAVPRRGFAATDDSRLHKTDPDFVYLRSLLNTEKHGVIAAERFA